MSRVPSSRARAFGRSVAEWALGITFYARALDLRSERALKQSSQRVCLLCHLLHALRSPVVVQSLAPLQRVVHVVVSSEISLSPREHVHVHVLPRREGDFARNDDVYDALEGREALDDDRRPQSMEEMTEEANALRALF